MTRDDALPLARGRWRIGDQLTRRGGQPLPVELSFDEYIEVKYKVEKRGRFLDTDLYQVAAYCRR
ncbi:hypothetical protein [Curtobacterium sp. 179-B 9B NHS]|uniref:hypothetical protein n=1 Tax=Curtobacterium sp. 179-B 9B NHS TaxID=3374293 RepID=UPI0038794BAC